MKVVAIILWIVIGVWVNKTYHKMFNVVYFGERGLLRELIGTILVSGFIVGVILGMIGNLFA